MTTDYVKLREQVIAEYLTGEHWQLKNTVVQTQVKMAPAMVDFIISGMRLIEGQDADDVSDIVAGIAASIATTVVNLTSIMQQPEEAASLMVINIGEYVIDSALGRVKKTSQLVPKKGH